VEIAREPTGILSVAVDSDFVYFSTGADSANRAALKRLPRLSPGLP
jgi:hypothetical protein